MTLGDRVKAARDAGRTIEGLWKEIGRLLETFTPSECANYFAAAGYDPT